MGIILIDCPPRATGKTKKLCSRRWTPTKLAEKTAWVRVFIREVSKRGHTTEDIIAVLDEPGMTVKEAVQRILSTGKPK
jgi:hypothetical protein